LRGTSNLGIISVLNDVIQLIIYGHAWKACPAIAAVKLQINAMCQKRKCIFYADSMIFIKFIVHSIRSHSAIRESRRHVRLRNTWLRQFFWYRMVNIPPVLTDNPILLMSMAKDPYNYIEKQRHIVCSLRTIRHLLMS
jgi:hypothetical protein